MEPTRALRSLVLVAICLAMNGCILLPVMDSMKQMGLTRSDREALLARDVKQFHEALYWGKPDRALALAMPDNRDAIASQLREMKRSHRIVESTIDSVDFADDAFTANVDVIVKYYAVPFYIVNERIEEHVWKFQMPDGWRLQTLHVRDGSS